MAMPQFSLSTNVTLEEIAAFFKRSVLTVRKWFEDDPDMVRTPRGTKQRPTLSMTVSKARVWLRQRGVPDAEVEEFVRQHDSHVSARAWAAASPHPPGPELVAKQLAGKSSKSSTSARSSNQIKNKSKSRKGRRSLSAKR